jgi:hypothetical protein
VTFTNFISGRTHLGEPIIHRHAELSLRPGETLRLVVRVTDTGEHPLEITVPDAGIRLPSSAHWSFTKSGAASNDPTVTPGTAATATFTYTVQAADVGQAFIVGLDASNGSTTNQTRWSLYLPTAGERQVVISEFLADPPTRPSDPNTIYADPLGRTKVPPGTATAASEFVELVNAGSLPIDLSGWTLGDSTAIPRHRLAGGTFLTNGGSMVIYGGPRTGAVPVLSVPAVPASSGGLSLNNGSDALTLRNARSNLIERVEFRGGQLGSGGSLVRGYLPDGSFLPHSALVPQPWSPGLKTDGTPWANGFPTETLPSPPTLQIEHPSNGTIRLRWNTTLGKPCRIVRSTLIDGPYTPVATGLITGEFSEVQRAATGFFRVEFE